MPSRLPKFTRVYVRDEAHLRASIASLHEPDALGLDVEMGQRILRLPGGVTRGKQILALIQLAAADVSLIIDPLTVTDLSPLEPLMRSKAVKVVLGGATDIQLLAEHGVHVRRVVDLAEMAVSVFGHKEEGMRALADRALGLEIDKTIRREDWLRRPITSEMLSYAHRDAELTLLLYRWFSDHHQDVVNAHIRDQLAPGPPPGLPEWIRVYLTKRVDPAKLLKETGVDPDCSKDRLTIDVRSTLERELSPPQLRRMIRLIGELRLSDLFAVVEPYASSPSSVFRSAAARALGRLGKEEGRTHLQRLLGDHIVDVSNAARVGLRDLDASGKKATDGSKASIEPSGLKPEALAVLEALRSKPLPADEPNSDVPPTAAVVSRD